ncbi:MAG: 2-succinyl-6-hydroxy-2,4-cyclohexadiene-1-carboxylate synthase [Ignavibacteriaceae bacterium]|nr:2-succinyl-6-hydroxy-2,4-cyclohexadiene-1-carboxylate synthase [Ignavibacteriaceae bacterium]
MIIHTSQVKLNVEYFPSLEKNAPFVFLLHGFTGSSAEWIDIISDLNNKFSYVAIDFIGHNTSSPPKDQELYTANSLIQQLDEVFNHFTKNRFFIVGYSMGGRAALSYTVHHPKKLYGLVLESASAGIVDEKLRKERIENDSKLIKMIEEKSIDEFVEYWMNQALFDSLKTLSKKKLAKIQNSKFKLQKVGLINSLKGFGTGVMPPLHDKLHLIDCKTLLITGELDKKFTQLNSELVNSFPSAKHVVVSNAGHNVHLEKPEEFVRAVNEFLE